MDKTLEEDGDEETRGLTLTSFLGLSCGGFCWTVQWSGIGTERQRTGTERNGRALENTGQIPVKRNSI